mmetsp:Transcript_28169/g.68498  ORF Transcript_28169/g.68498 Transcript_28169/m.68498 type:complete len:211 (+) Transcript_28169:424-1056(+)
MVGPAVGSPCGSTIIWYYSCLSCVHDRSVACRSEQRRGEERRRRDFHENFDRLHHSAKCRDRVRRSDDTVRPWRHDDGRRLRRRPSSRALSVRVRPPPPRWWPPPQRSVFRFQKLLRTAAEDGQLHGQREAGQRVLRRRVLREPVRRLFEREPAAVRYDRYVYVCIISVCQVLFCVWRFCSVEGRKEGTSDLLSCLPVWAYCVSRESRKK